MDKLATDTSSSDENFSEEEQDLNRSGGTSSSTAEDVENNLTSNNQSADASGMPRPGAYHISGPCIRESLPVAALVPEIELVDGEPIVSPRANKKKKSYLLEAFFFLVSIFTIGYFVRDVILQERSEPPAILPQDSILSSSWNPTAAPSLSSSPTMSSQPSTVRTQAMKQILIPISGEEILDDPTSNQNFMWHFLSETDSQRLPVDNPKAIIQRYATGIVGLGVLNYKKYNYKLMVESSSHFHDCEIFYCNENGEITDLVILNNWETAAGGTIPTEVGILTSMQRLVIRNNKSIGTIPSEIANLHNLKLLDLGANLLTGPVPTEIGKLQSLEWLILADNHLQSTIPKEIGNMTNLHYGGFWNNSMTGTVPVEMDGLEKLNGLDLSGNMVSGDLEFLCDHDFSGKKVDLDSSLTNKLYWGKPYNVSVELSVKINCETDMMEVGCSCCRCV